MDWHLNGLTCEKLPFAELLLENATYNRENLVFFLTSMIVDFSEPRAPKEKSHPIFFCPLGSFETVYTVAISKN